MSDQFNDGGLAHSSFAATTSDGITRDFERFLPNRKAKTINQYNPNGTPKKSADTRDFVMASATIQVETATLGVPNNMPAAGITMVLNTGYGNETWRLVSVDGPGFQIGEYWKYETTWQKNEN